MDVLDFSRRKPQVAGSGAGAIRCPPAILGWHRDAANDCNVAARHHSVGPRLSRPKAGAFQAWLSPRERETLQLVAKGFSDAEIGSFLGISAQTVGTHLKHVFQKLCVHSRTEAVYEATAGGLLRF